MFYSLLTISVVIADSKLQYWIIVTAKINVR
jgi:hypothetical protein